MIRLFLISLAALLLLSNSSVAGEKSAPSQKPTQVETLQQIDTMQKVSGLLEDMKLMAERNAQKKYSDCLKAFGNHAFCQCLRDQSPIGIDFADYVKVVTTTKDELGYSKADKETKQLIDNTLKAREACVGDK